MLAAHDRARNPVRLLQGPQGAVLRQIARSDSRLGQVRRAIVWIREHYDQPLRIETLAELAGMSAALVSSAFQGRNRDEPAPISEVPAPAAGEAPADRQPRRPPRAGYAVGYESTSQFSREYARLFGLPPARDAVRLRSDSGRFERRRERLAPKPPPRSRWCPTLPAPSVSPSRHTPVETASSFRAASFVLDVAPYSKAIHTKPVFCSGSHFDKMNLSDGSRRLCPPRRQRQETEENPGTRSRFSLLWFTISAPARPVRNRREPSRTDDCGVKPHR